MFVNARNPRWENKAHGQIVLEVLPEGCEEFCTFVASPNDCTEYGPMLFNFAVNGVFGQVADSDEERIISGELEPPEGYSVIDGEIVNVAAKEAEAQAVLDGLLAGFNSEEAKARAEIDGEYAAERKAKLAALLAVKQQEGWPLAVKWPEFV